MKATQRNYELCQWQINELNQAADQGMEQPLEMNLVCYPVLHKDWLEVIFLDLIEEELFRFALDSQVEWTTEMVNCFHKLCRRRDLVLIGCSIKRIKNWAEKRYGIKIHRHINETGILFQMIYCEEIRRIQDDTLMLSSKLDRYRVALFMMGLEHIASYLDKFEDIDLIANDIPSFFDGIWLGVLRSINSHYGARLLMTEEKRKKIAYIQGKQTRIFDHVLSDMECIALDLFLQRYGAERAGRVFLRNRPKIQYAEEYEEVSYLTKIVGKREDLIGLFPFERCIKIMDSGDTTEFTDIAFCTRYCFDKEYALDDVDEQKISDARKKYEYASEGLELSLPIRREVFYRESMELEKRWLMFLQGEEDVYLLFLRESDTNQTIANLRVYQNCVMDVIPRLGRPLGEQEKLWIRMYAEEKDFMLLDSCIDESDSRYSLCRFWREPYY